MGTDTIKKQGLAALALGAIGVVYGDIGTSPLYTMQVIFNPATGISLTQNSIFGAVSAIFWLLMAIVTLKYVVLVMRADNNGEGGVMALLALVIAKLHPHNVIQRWLVWLGVMGAALFYGDSVLTPAISVLSAVEGLKIAYPALSNAVLPLSMAILLALFSLQRYGTQTVGRFFGPIVITWFLLLAVVGGMHIFTAPEILQALHPRYAWQFLHALGLGVFLAIGAILLAVTGAEALYADMGHFGRPAIQWAWIGLVFPCLVLNYLGQGALLLHHPEAIENPFFLSFPKVMLIPVVVLATMATIIASQAVISGAFSMTRQAIQLGFLPRMRIQHTSATTAGQIYMPAVNWTLCIAVIMVCLTFKTSAALASAYGIAVTGTMLVTTFLMIVLMRLYWKLSWGLIISLSGLMVCLDMILLGSAAVKFMQGGWFPVALSACVMVMMTTWKTGRACLLKQTAYAGPKLLPFVQDLVSHPMPRVARTAVYMVSDLETVPQALLHNLKHNQVLHQHTLFVNVIFTEEPYVNAQNRSRLTLLTQNFWQLQLRYGFMQTADIPRALQQITLDGQPIDLFSVSYFLNRDIIVTDSGGAMPRWRDQIFAAMMRNAGSAVEFFNIPANSVIELGSRIQL